MPRLALLMPVFLLAACSAPMPFAGAPAAPAEAHAGDPRLEACRAEATRIVQWRERGQVMRADETESGRGTLTIAPFSRAENDRAFAQMERDRIIAECMRGNPRAGS